jgi:predicted DCC family thiol-disulfide oxidoreductase YuxK
VYDGDCAFCSTSARLLTGRLRHDHDDFDVMPWQVLDLARLGLTEAECIEAVQWVGVDRSVDAGHVAVARALRASRRWARPVGHLILMPGVRAVAAVLYRWIARNRHRLPGGTPACRIEP